MVLREDIERREEKTLSDFASKARQSKGRRHFEEECHIRTAFQRDRDRIIHSKSFRRLKHKTQVFISPEGDHFRTRLTHTLEVSQIARTIARALGLNEDLTEAIALGHDLGHTPFGHAGEEALDRVFPPGFSHSQQSLRVVDFLEQNGGLNLTWEVRDGIANHSSSGSPTTLEGQIVRWADRFAYINHDIDDAIRGGIIEEKELPQQYIKVLGDRHRTRINTMVMDMIKASQDKPKICLSPEVEEAVCSLRQYMFDHVYIGSLAKAEETKAKELLIALYRLFVTQPNLLPQEYRNMTEDFGLERAVVDYISGMTDRFALKTYEKYFLPSPWLIGKD
ncbi:deoxyguanosinetriphosphate triphosphohydrolase [Heliorestis acidaminivorans]|uniref:Deoxyguanosinetriphosphate triphosphohydrolase-like protein n=1 Tax=Heliorestis acidaminivorans TaxID=553427 RepID=A0A6I0F493_9FIRM|nr:deoxyguanosinetriphosphate triphosphohydrolase [Heliorestis acidaminivorans]KAB2954580.1 deoxyguanosinetriphosphate triphosphohydrolase [Heliorestis acidaminivorans]